MSVTCDRIVIIPTYNESENIERMINTVFDLSLDFHILIIDDGSPDGTAQIVKNLQKTYAGRLHMVEREGKLGLGTAYIRGFQWALRGGYEYIFEMDADFSHNPKDLIRLHEACVNGADVSVGSRYVKGGDVKNWDFKRIMLSYCASWYVRFILWISIKDPTAGFVCYRRRVLEKIALKKIQFIGYAFQIEMKYTALRHGFKIAEVPITFIDRELGVSKMSSKIFREALLGVFIIKNKEL